MFGVSSDLNSLLALFILAITIIIVCSFCYKKPKNVQLFLVVLTLSLFIYSGIGIAFEEVNNRYIVHYVIFLACLLLPFSIIKSKELSSSYSGFDQFILGKLGIIKKTAILYFILLLIPCVFPTFKLDNVFKFFSEGNLIGIFDTYNNVRKDNLYSICNTLSMFLQPALYIYIGILVERKEKKLAVSLIVIQMLLKFCPSAYLGRGQLIIYAVFIIFVLLPPIQNGKFVKKTFAVIGGLLVASMPLLYAFTFFRLGEVADKLTFLQATEAMFLSESYYPIFYDHIVISFNDPTALITMVLWIICLPIPSALWSTKPVIDKFAFTYSVTGLTVDDKGFAILLPSALGEGLVMGGSYFFFVYALIVGFVYALFMKFLYKHKTLHYLIYFILIYSFEFGRCGAGATIPTLINGNILLLLTYYVYLRQSLKKTAVR